MDWIDAVNKKLEEINNGYKDNLENGTITSRRNSYASSQVSTETRSKGGKASSEVGRQNLTKLNNDTDHQINASLAAGKVAKDKKNALWTEMLSQLENKEHFTSKDLREVLKKYNYTHYKAILRSEFVECILNCDSLSRHYPRIYKVANNFETIT